MIKPFIAHRGEPVSWPENSLAGYQGVLEAGAAYIETDVQITADGIAVLNHDPSVLRTTGVDLQVTTTDYATLHELSAGYAERFSDQYRGFRISRLDELIALLQHWPDVQVFVELKQASLTTHGISQVVDTIMEQIKPIQSQIVVISFNHEVLQHIRSHHTVAVGWVLHEWSDAGKQMATALKPDFLFCDYKRLPADTGSLWAGPWRWVVYTINTSSEVPALLERGIDLIETDVIRQFLDDKTLQESLIG